jgi:hypothetical protein
LTRYKDVEDRKEEQRAVYRAFFSGLSCPAAVPTGYSGPDLCLGLQAGRSYPGVEQRLFDYFKMEGTPKDGQFQVSRRGLYR